MGIDLRKLDPNAINNRLSPEHRESWLPEMTALDVPAAVARVRAVLAELEATRVAKPGK